MNDESSIEMDRLSEREKIATVMNAIVRLNPNVESSKEIATFAMNFMAYKKTMQKVFLLKQVSKKEINRWTQN